MSESTVVTGSLESTLRASLNLPPKNQEISVGSALPFGPRMYHHDKKTVVRMKDIGQSRRILVVGVLGSFTPDCWNRHLYLVLKHYDYFKERGVDHICCISTNDPYVHSAWGEHLGCDDKVLMWSDSTYKYTTALGMDVIIPWLDDRIRTQRFVLLADDMIVTKMIKCDWDITPVMWDCEHLIGQSDIDDSNSEFRIRCDKGGMRIRWACAHLDGKSDIDDSSSEYNKESQI